jgi:hypothetical protein
MIDILRCILRSWQSKVTIRIHKVRIQGFDVDKRVVEIVVRSRILQGFLLSLSEIIISEDWINYFILQVIC